MWKPLLVLLLLAVSVGRLAVTDCHARAAKAAANREAASPKEAAGSDGPIAAPPVRVPWTTSRVIGTPEPPPPLRGQEVFGKLKFTHPLYAVMEPGASGRMLVVEQKGKVWAFAHDEQVETKDLFCEIDDHDTYSICFHPRFAENRYVYVFANGPQSDREKRFNRILRYTVSQGEPRRCDPESQTTIIEWRSNGHNGGEMAFGPDGYLYLSSGDGTSDSDGDLAGQDLSTLTAAILRIDVDGAPAGSNYRVPDDNPFLHLADARPEIWAYGFRNPWRLCFDRATGDLWVGDIGQDLWEMVHVVQRGANYGWSVMEGSRPFYPLRKRGPTPISPPTIEHPHSEARSITGGIVYTGERFAELKGAYLYGDYATGKVWGVRYQNGQITWQKELADTAYQILGFCQGPGGEIYLVDYAGGIYSLQRRPDEKPPHPFPRKLSETGLFADTPRHEVHPALVAYDVVAPLWSDGADKQRFIALPDESLAEFRPSGAWKFPEHTVLVKTFSLPTVDPATGQRSDRRIETRLLTLQQGEWQGYTYRWNDAQTDADLVPAAGADQSYWVSDSEEPTGRRQQAWHFPSRTECMVCHSRAAGFVLGPHTNQMDRAIRFHGETINQLDHFASLGVLKGYRRQAIPEQRRLVDPTDESAPLELRARSYLHANCAQCHVEAGGGNSAFSIHITRTPQQLGLIDQTPRHDRFGIDGARLIAPGKPQASILHHRLTTLGRGRMPPLGSAVIDRKAAHLIAQWIEDLAPVEAPPPGD